jgi:membrane protein
MARNQAIQRRTGDRGPGSFPQLLLGLGVAWLALSNRRRGGHPTAAPLQDAPGPVRAASRRSLPHGSGAGRRAESPTEIPAQGWWAILQRVWAEIGRDNMSIIAAGCAFYAMLALFPALTAMVSIYGLVADPAAVQQHVSALEGILPQEAASLIVGQMQSVASGSSGVLGWSAAIAILLALYSASSGVKTLFTALNVAYEEEETRGFIRFNLTALVFTFLAILSVIIGLGIIVGVPAALSWLPLGAYAAWGVRIASWLVLLLLVILGLAMIYRFGPSRAPANWRWLTPGSFVAALLWLAASAGFSFYAANFASYNETYGALGGVIILLMWLYISAFVVLLGAELNAEIELQTEKDTTTGAPQPMGQRKAYAADHVAGGRTA